MTEPGYNETLCDGCHEICDLDDARWVTDDHAMGWLKPIPSGHYCEQCWPWQLKTESAWSTDMSRAPTDGTWIVVAVEHEHLGKNVYLAFGTEINRPVTWLGDVDFESWKSSDWKPYAWHPITDPPPNPQESS